MKILPGASPPSCTGSTNVVSERFISRAMRCIRPSAMPVASKNTASALRGEVLRGRLDAEAARTALGAWARLGLRRFAADGLLPRVWELRDNLTAHDATYVALAEALGCELVTADARLAQAPGLRCTITVVRR